MKKKKACSNLAISRWLGAYVSACQQTWGLAAKSSLKGSLCKGAYLNVLVFLCTSTFCHVYTEAGAWSHTSFLVCICLAVFTVVSVLCVLAASLPSRLCLITARALCSLLLYFFLLCFHNRVVISSESTSCPWQFQDDTLTLKMWRLANIVWAFLGVKLLRGQQIKPRRIFICYISILLCIWQLRWSYPSILIWSWISCIVRKIGSGQKHYLCIPWIKQNVLQLMLNYSLYYGYFCFDVKPESVCLVLNNTGQTAAYSRGVMQKVLNGCGFLFLALM